MPRIFLPAVTAKNNALLAGDTQVPSGDFEFQHSDHDSSSEEDESTSPDLLHPACHKRAQRPRQQQQQQQQSEVGGRSAAAAAFVATGNTKRARVQDEDRRTRTQSHVNGQSNSSRNSTTGSQGQAEPPQEDDTFAVVFMTVALGITLAAPPSSDADDSLVVCDKDINANATSKICIGDRLAAVGDTSAAGLSVDRVQRLIVRGSRPLEMTFRRRRSTSDGGATAKKYHQRPLGGLERPSHDCLLDTISNIATQEDCFLPDSQPQWPEHQQETLAGVNAAVSDRGRKENGGQGGDRSSPRNDTGRSSPSLSPPSPPLLSPVSPRRSSAAGGGDDNGHVDRRGLPHRPGETLASAQAQASPALSSSPSFTDVDQLSPNTAGRETQAAILAAAAAAVTSGTPPPSPPARRENARAAAATPVVLEPSEAAGAPEPPWNAPRMAASAELAPLAQAPALTPSGSGSVAGTAKEPDSKRPKSHKKKNKKKIGGSASTTAASAAISPRQLVGNGRGSNTTAANNNNGNDKAGSTGSSSSGGGGSGTERLAAAPQASSSPAGTSALAPSAAEVTRILAKLGARGVSELTLYKNLTFDELVRVCRYTGGIDLSKRLQKATMAERLNSLCVEQGALARELRAAAGGTEARAENGPGIAGKARSAQQQAGYLHGEALSTPGRPPAAPTPPPRRGAPRSDTFAEPPSAQLAASPPPLRRPSHARGDAQALPHPSRSSSLARTPFAGSMTTPQQHQRQRQQLPLSPRSWDSSDRGRNVRAEALPTSPTAAVREEHGSRGGAAGAEDDQDCWEDWDFLDNARGHGRSGVAGRKTRAGEEGRGGGGNDGDEEAAWWSQDADHRDWSPCSSPTAAAAAAAGAPPSRSFPASRLPTSSASPPTSPSAGERSWDGEGREGEELGRRRNPLLPPALPSLPLFSGQQQQQGRVAQSSGAERFSGGRLGFTALPKWILRPVRTIGTQVE